MNKKKSNISGKETKGTKEKVMGVFSKMKAKAGQIKNAAITEYNSEGAVNMRKYLSEKAGQAVAKTSKTLVVAKKFAPVALVSAGTYAATRKGVLPKIVGGLSIAGGVGIGLLNRKGKISDEYVVIGMIEGKNAENILSADKVEIVRAGGNGKLLINVEEGEITIKRDNITEIIQVGNIMMPEEGYTVFGMEEYEDMILLVASKPEGSEEVEA